MISKKNKLSKNKAKFSSRKGISLVEVVVALTIISIISVAAFSLIMSSMDLENNIMRDVEISASADDVLDCFMFAKTEAEFAEGMRALGYMSSATGTYRLEKGCYEIVVTYSEKSVKFLAWDVSSGVDILQIEHTKG